MNQKPFGNRKVVLTWIGVAPLTVPVFVMLDGRPKLGLVSGISIALGFTLLVLGSIRS